MEPSVQDTITGLRQLADYLDEHSDLVMCSGARAQVYEPPPHLFASGVADYMDDDGVVHVSLPFGPVSLVTILPIDVWEQAQASYEPPPSLLEIDALSSDVRSSAIEGAKR